MQQISNPKRSVIAIPGVRKRCRDEEYLAAINGELDAPPPPVAGTGATAASRVQPCGVYVKPFVLSEVPYGSSAHAIRDTANLSATVTASIAAPSSSAAPASMPTITVGGGSAGNKSLLSALGSIAGGDNSNSQPAQPAVAAAPQQQLQHQPFGGARPSSPPAAPSTTVRVMGPTLRELQVVRVRYAADEVDASWLSQYNYGATARLQQAQQQHYGGYGGPDGPPIRMPTSGGKVGGKGSAVAYNAATGETIISIGGGVAPSANSLASSSSSDLMLMAPPATADHLSIPLLEDAFSLLELHYRYVGYAAPAASLRLRPLLTALGSAADPISVLAATCVSEEEEGDVPSIAALLTSGASSGALAGSSSTSTPGPADAAATPLLGAAADTDEVVEVAAPSSSSAKSRGAAAAKKKGRGPSADPANFSITSIASTSTLGASASVAGYSAPSNATATGMGSPALSSAVAQPSAVVADSSSSPLPIYGVPTHRLTAASDDALSALRGYWLVRRAAMGLHSDGLVPDAVPPAVPTGGKAKAGGSSGGSATAATAGGSGGAAKAQAAVYATADSIPCHRRSLIPALCRDEGLFGPHGVANAAMAHINAAVNAAAAAVGPSASVVERRRGGLVMGGAADALVGGAGDGQAAFADYAVPFAHRTWECPIFVQQPVECPSVAAAALSQQSGGIAIGGCGSSSSIVGQPSLSLETAAATAEESAKLADHLADFSGLSAAFVGALRERELRAQEALRLHMYQLALLRSEAESALDAALGLAADVAEAAAAHSAGGTSSSSSLPSSTAFSSPVAAEIAAVRAALLPSEGLLAAHIREDEEW